MRAPIIHHYTRESLMNKMKQTKDYISRVRKYTGLSWLKRHWQDALSGLILGVSLVGALWLLLWIGSPILAEAVQSFRAIG